MPMLYMPVHGPKLCMQGFFFCVCVYRDFCDKFLCGCREQLQKIQSIKLEVDHCTAEWKMLTVMIGMFIGKFGQYPKLAFRQALLVVVAMVPMLAWSAYLVCWREHSGGLAASESSRSCSRSQQSKLSSLGFSIQIGRIIPVKYTSSCAFIMGNET